MKRLVTVARSSDKFKKYLLGSFAANEVAIPVQAEDPTVQTEDVTFAIFEKSSVQTPPFLKKWAIVFRVHDIFYAMLPMYLVMVKLQWDGIPWDPLLALFTTFAVLFVSLGAILVSDYLDYTKGFDRLVQGRGAQGLLKGWVTAQQTFRWGVFWGVIGVLFALPVLWVFPFLILYVVVPAGFALGLWLLPATGFKYRMGAEFTLFLLYGPLLTIGFETAVADSFDLETVLVGVLTGLFFVTRMHLKNFTHLMEHHRLGLPNALSRLGFDGGKIFFRLWWLIVVATLLFYQILYHGREWGIVFGLMAFFSGYALFFALRKANSPMVSVLKRFEEQGTKAFALLLAAWLLQTLWQLLIIEVG